MKITWLLALAVAGPQAWVDMSDWARERNERGIYQQELEYVESYCDVWVGPDDYPTTFPVLGMKGGQYHIKPNAVVYPLGDHDVLRHEMLHAILWRTQPPIKCLHEMIADGDGEDEEDTDTALRRAWRGGS